MRTTSTSLLVALLAATAMGAQEARQVPPQETLPQETEAPTGWRRVETEQRRQTPPDRYSDLDRDDRDAMAERDRRAPSPSRGGYSVPDRVTIPAGTWLTIRVDQLLSTRHNRPGDIFAATLAQPIIVDGLVIARRGQTISGAIAEVTRGGRIRGTARLGIEVAELGMADGQQLPVRAQLVDLDAGTSRGRDGIAVATTTGLGAAIGAGAAGGAGAGLGAIAGAGASLIGVLLTRGRDVDVPEETILRFRLLDPVTVNTTRSQFAFQAVEQSDFETRPLQRRVQMAGSPGWGGGWGGWGGGPWLLGPGWGPGWVGGWGWGPGWGRGWGGGWGRGGRRWR